MRSDSQTQRRDKNETKLDNLYYCCQNDKNDTNTLLFNKLCVTKKRYNNKRRGANLALPKSKSSPGGAASHAGVPSQPLPKLEPSILSLIRIFS